MTRIPVGCFVNAGNGVAARSVETQKAVNNKKAKDRKMPCRDFINSLLSRQRITIPSHLWQERETKNNLRKSHPKTAITEV
jgi:hypothetical protein